MKLLSVPRWTVSFADLALLLLSFFILLHAGSAREVAAGARAAFSSQTAAGPLLEESAASLFEPGEARLKSDARARLVGIGRAAGARGRALVVDSHGRDPAARRFDGWELAAARAAALARALAEGGVAEDRVSIVLPAGRGEEGLKEQRLIVRFGG
jgi:flagellar motor protein MotB